MHCRVLSCLRLVLTPSTSTSIIWSVCCKSKLASLCQLKGEDKRGAFSGRVAVTRIVGNCTSKGGIEVRGGKRGRGQKAPDQRAESEKEGDT